MTPPPLDQEEDETLVPVSDLAPNGPQPMEVVPAEAANAVDTPSVDDPPSARFTWTIENFRRLNTRKLYSKIFLVGEYKWRVLLFPKGNNVEHLSMYLVVADSATLPYKWSRYAQFSLAVINQLTNKFTVRKDTQHQFNARESDWGFTSFLPLGELYDPNRGYLVNDTVVVEANVAIRKVVDYWSYDSKEETGYVGLKNQGATSHMNSLLQTLYHIPYFRKAVYRMPTTENDMPSGSIPSALQSLFYKLQYSDTSVATKELTKSFGWDRCDFFMEHDVQELNRVLCEKLEDKMKGTVVEGTIQQLFEGHHMNYIECINVDYKSTRKESFYDLQLDVKGCRDVYASFDKYVEEEHLEGDNKYHAEQYGLQETRKGVLFIDFPPVLLLQLKRFEYDFMRDTLVKINDRYEFPLQLDLDIENGKYLSPDADRSVRNLYTLHSVLVHSGGGPSGPYYAFIRPTLSDQWFKYNDERVTKEDKKRALEEQYGGEEELPQINPGLPPFKFTKYSNAYMLVYIRESDKEKIIYAEPKFNAKKRKRKETGDNSSGNVEAGITRTLPPQSMLQSILGSQINFVDASSEATATAGKVRFLSCWVSSETFLLLEKIHRVHNGTFVKFSMKVQALQTMLLESFASFIVSMSSFKVNDVSEEALRLAAISIEDFEKVGLDLRWLKERLEEAKTVKKYSEAVNTVDSCGSALEVAQGAFEVARAQVHELEEGLANAKAEVEVMCSRELPKSVGVNDFVLKDIV